MTAQHGREKAEEWLAVCQDFADDLLASHGEEAVEEFWGRLRQTFDYQSRLAIVQKQIESLEGELAVGSWASILTPYAQDRMGNPTEFGRQFVQNVVELRASGDPPAQRLKTAFDRAVREVGLPAPAYRP